MAETVQFTGTIEKVFFHRPERDYMIGQLRDDETGRRVRFLGSMPQAQSGQYWQIEGSWVHHPIYGEQLEVRSSAPAIKPIRDLLVRYLSSDLFEGVGRKTAQTLVDTLGDDCISEILKDPSVLETRCHLKASTAEKILGPLQQMSSFGHRITQLLSWGLSQAEINLLQEFSEERFAQLKDDPFLPYYSLRGFGYQGGLKLADGYLLEDSSPKRIEAALLHELTELCYRSGSTCTDAEGLRCRLSLPRALFDQAVNGLLQRGLIQYQDGLLYLMELFVSEQMIASGILDHTWEVEPVAPETLDRILAEIESESAITYDSGQRQAIETFFASSMMILNGGPGTGKSTLLLGLLKAIHRLYPAEKVTLCAPTGRAAKRMKELSNVHARTIHSLLRWNPVQDSFAVDEHDPINCRFLIIDEFSMVDSRLFASLLRAVPDECRILIIGDEDQLESVGPGNVLRDLIDSGRIPVVHLETLHRQKEGSGIPVLAAQIRQEEALTFLDPVRFLSPQGSTVACLKDCILLEDNPESVQILAPKYAGESGILAINSMMQELVNPFDPNRAQLVTHVSAADMRREVIFRVGDKVLLKRNLPELDVFNGDIGRIAEIDPAAGMLIADFGDTMVEFEKSELHMLAHAWCISIHKSQGSEYQKACVIADENAAGMLRKRLLYTAVSRAKASLTIIGDENLFRSGVRRSDENRRFTTLVRRIEERFALSRAAGQTKKRPGCLAQPELGQKPADPAGSEQTSSETASHTA